MPPSHADVPRPVTSDDTSSCSNGGADVEQVHDALSLYAACNMLDNYSMTVTFVIDLPNFVTVFSFF